MTHICVGKLTIIGSDNGLSPGRRQAIIWTDAGILLIGPLGTNFSEITIEIRTLSLKKMRLKMSSGNWRPFCLGLNVLKVLGHHQAQRYQKLQVCPSKLRKLSIISIRLAVHVSFSKWHNVSFSKWQTRHFEISWHFLWQFSITYECLS